MPPRPPKGLVLYFPEVLNLLLKEPISPKFLKSSPKVLKNVSKKPQKSPKKSNSPFPSMSAAGLLRPNLVFNLKRHNWTGLLAEPNPYAFESLRQNHRKAWLLPHCFSTKTTPEVVEFDADEMTGRKIMGTPDRCVHTI